MTVLYHNGFVVTGRREQDLSQPCTCLVVDDGVIAFVGDSDDPLVRDVKHDREVDLEARTVVPGFIDG